jgi:hypothetical protein
MQKKVIRLNEQDIENLVKKIIKEEGDIKYLTLWDKIQNSTMIEGDYKKELYDICVEEYLDMGEDPNEASMNDIYEIADASEI